MSSQWMGAKPQEAVGGGQLPVVTSILKDFSAEALGELRTWFEQNPMAIPITQIIGWSQFAGFVSEVTTLETTASLAYTDLATVGPSLTGLSSGSYAVHMGAYMFNSGANPSIMSLSVNGVAASDADNIVNNGTNGVSCARGYLKTLTGSDNTITAKYRVNAGTSTFQLRWLLAFKISNL